MKFNAKKLTKEIRYCEELFEHYIKIKVLRKTDSDYKKHINKAGICCNFNIKYCQND